jgi:hypothetical protein
MRPVNLAPGDAPVAVAVDGGKPNLGMIGGAVAGVVAIAVVAGYFAMARVNTVKEEVSVANAAAAKATQDAQAIEAQVASLGQPVVDSDKQLAQGQQQIVVAAYTERHDFVTLAQELRGIMQQTGGWYESVTASANGATASGSSSSSSSGPQSVTIVGVMPTRQMAASFDQRVNATRTLENAEFVEIKTVQKVQLGSKSRTSRTYWQFTIAADLVDTEAPFVSGSSSSAGTGSATGVAVGDAGAGSGSLELSLDPKPKAEAKPAAPAQPAKPRNPFDVAASSARGGGS